MFDRNSKYDSDDSFRNNCYYFYLWSIRVVFDNCTTRSFKNLHGLNVTSQLKNIKVSCKHLIL